MNAIPIELQRPNPDHAAENRRRAMRENLSSAGVSVGVHLAVLVAMAFIHQTVVKETPPNALMESFSTEEPTRQDFEKVLDVDTTPADSMNVDAGGAVSSAAVSITGGNGGTGGGGGLGGGGGGGGVRDKIEGGSAFRGPKVNIGSGDIAGPGTGIIGLDLGEGGVKGEGGAMVEGYGAALGRMTQELVRMMRTEPVVCVWLFDESESMKDDQKEIRENFHKVYEELGLVSKKDNDLKKKGQDILLTSVIGYGEKYHPLTPKPTSNIEEIKGSIDKIAIDESGKENTCQAILKAVDDHKQLASRQKRKLVIIVVTDESGDDGDKVEDALEAAKKAHAPIYIMGREAIFGYKYARIKWQDPKYKLWHWLPIMRGPETPFRECLQWDGLHARWDSFSSGFGPYEQVRLAKETGGIFFVLPGEEENLSGAGANEKRQFDALDMKEYEPQLTSRREYAEQVSKSKFRSTLSECIRIMDPEVDKELNIREHGYSLELEKFKAEASAEVHKAVRSMTGLNQVIPMLEGLKPLRAGEKSERWRAHYDLMLAQCYAYRIRLFQYLLAMDDHVAKNPKITKANSNNWDVARVPKMIEPDDAQYERLKGAFKLKQKKSEYLQELKEQEQRARELFEYVTTEHPRTPWARRALFELGMGFGMTFYDVFRDPNYSAPGIKVPNF